MNAGVSLNLTLNSKFRTLADSWLVTMTMVAARAAPKARSLSRMMKTFLLVIWKINLLAFFSITLDELQSEKGNVCLYVIINKRSWTCKLIKKTHTHTKRKHVEC